MDVRHTSWDLDGFEIGPGWSWDANFRNLMKVIHHLDGGDMQISGDGLRWTATLVRTIWHGWRWDRASIEVYHTSPDLGGGETWPGLRWHMNIRTWMELRHCLEGGVMWLYGPGLGWGSTCMEVRLKSLDPHPDETGHGWRWDTYLESLMGLWGCNFGGLDWGETSHGWRWDTNMRIWIEVRSHMDGKEAWINAPGGGETQISRPGWGWDGTWIELRHTSLDLGEIGLWTNWDSFLVALMMRYNLNGD